MGNFFAEKSAVALAQAMNRDFDGRGTHVELSGEFGLRGGAAGHHVVFELAKLVGLASVDAFAFEAREDFFQNGQGPAAFEDFFRGCVVARFEEITRFSGLFIEGNDLRSAAAFLGAQAVPFVRKEMFERGKQERTEFAARRIDLREIIFLEEAREEGLGEILRVVRRETFAPDVGVKRIPIFAAEIFQRGGATRRAALGGLKDFRPARGEEHLLPGIYGLRHWLKNDLM